MEESGPQEVTFRIKGSPGTQFSGTYAVGGEGHVLSGRVSKDYAYDLGG